MKLIRIAVTGTLMLSAAAAMAQSGKLPDPADPGAGVPAAKHESAFSDYQPFREEKTRSWKEVNQEVADNPGMGSMGSMKGMPGMEMKHSVAPKPGEAAGHDMSSMKGMPGMDSKAGTAAKSKAGAPGHDMSSMKGMPGMDSKAGDAPAAREGTGGHHGSMQDMQGKAAATAPMRAQGHGAMAMARPQTAPGHPAPARTGEVTATGVVRSIDKANGKVQLTHDPIAALGWPQMTMFFRLKDAALAEQVKEGEKVGFSLEKSASGYVISGFHKGVAGHDMKQMK